MNELTYQPLDDSHAKSIMPIWSDEDVIRYTNIKSPLSIEEISSKICALKVFDVFVVLQDNNVIGIIGCPCISKEEQIYGLFYQFRKSAWGQGYATIATHWLLEFMNHKYQNLTLFADVVVDNVASEKILLKYGFKFVDEDAFNRNGIKAKIHSYKK